MFGGRDERRGFGRERMMADGSQHDHGPKALRGPQMLRAALLFLVIAFLAGAVALYLGYSCIGRRPSTPGSGVHYQLKDACVAPLPGDLGRVVYSEQYDSRRRVRAQGVFRVEGKDGAEAAVAVAAPFIAGGVDLYLAEVDSPVGPFVVLRVRGEPPALHIVAMKTGVVSESPARTLPCRRLGWFVTNDDGMPVFLPAAADEPLLTIEPKAQ